MPSEDKLNRGVASLNTRWDILSNLNLQIRGSVDRSQATFEQKMNASTATVVAGTSTGRYIYINSTSNQFYGDALLSFNKPVNTNLSFNGTLGTSITDNTVNTDNFDTGSAGLNFANIFTIGNMNSASSFLQQTPQRRQLQAVFGSAQLAIKDAIFIDLSGRNDWSSTLANTSMVSKGYFYPSAGLSVIASQLIDMPDAVNFAKVRFSYAKVGNDFSSFITNSYPVFQGNLTVAPLNAAGKPLSSLKPELSTSMEIGTELKFLDNKLTLDFTAFKTNTTNQLLTIPTVGVSLTPNWYINAGDIQNKGIEVVLGITPVKTATFSYAANLNYSLNLNKVITLGPDVDAGGGIFLTNSDNNSYNYKVTAGRPYGDIYGVDFQRDAQGAIVIVDGLPLKNSGAFTLLGNPAPNFIAGLNNNFKYKNVSFSFLVDGRFGGKVMSLTQATLDLNGTSQASADAHNAGFVMVEGNKITDVAKYYGIIGGRAGVSSQYMYDATAVRMREAVLGYIFPSSMIGGKIVKG